LNTIEDTIIGTLFLNFIDKFTSPSYPFTFRPDSLVGYIKSDLAPGIDNYNLIYLTLYNDTTIIGIASYTNDSSLDSYTRFSIEINYFSSLAPDRIVMSIFAGNPNSPYPKNTFFVDDLSLIYNQTNVKIYSEGSSLNVYPNPAHNQLLITTNYTYETEFKIYNASGVLIKDMTINEIQANVTIEDLNKGIYFYQITDKNGIILKADKFIKE